MNAEKINAINLFEKDIVVLYSEKVKSINGFVQMQQITHSLTNDDVQNLKEIVFSRLWTWADIKIDRTKIEKDSKEVLLSPDDALEILYPGQNSIEWAFHKATLAIYKLPCNGKSDAFHYGQKGSGLKFVGDYSNSSLSIYLYTNKDINEEIALELRSKRDKVLDRIDYVLQENRNYIASKIEEFKKLISDLIDDIYNREIKRNDINNLL